MGSTCWLQGGPPSRLEWAAQQYVGRGGRHLGPWGGEWGVPAGGFHAVTATAEPACGRHRYSPFCSAGPSPWQPRPCPPLPSAASGSAADTRVQTASRAHWLSRILGGPVHARSLPGSARAASCSLQASSAPGECWQPSGGRTLFTTAWLPAFHEPWAALPNVPTLIWLLSAAHGPGGWVSRSARSLPARQGGHSAGPSDLPLRLAFWSLVIPSHRTMLPRRPVAGPSPSCFSSASPTLRLSLEPLAVCHPEPSRARAVPGLLHMVTDTERAGDAGRASA